MERDVTKRSGRVRNRRTICLRRERGMLQMAISYESVTHGSRIEI